MKTFTKATVSSVKVDDIYEATMTAEIDGANEFIWLTDKHVNTVKGISETKSMAISFKQLESLKAIIRKIEDGEL
jgi:hypothetical protein